MAEMQCVKVNDRIAIIVASSKGRAVKQNKFWSVKNFRRKK